MGTVVIIGGGSAGAPAARTLKKKLGPEHRVILVEKEEKLVNRAALPLYAVGKRNEGQFSRSRSLLNRRGVELIAGEVLKIDGSKKKIYTGREEMGYDLLLIAAGAEPDGAETPGMKEAGLDLQTFAGVKKLRDALPRFQGAEIAIVAASTRIKCPAGPYEYALLLEDWFYRRERKRDLSMTLYTPEQTPLSMFGKRVSDAAAGLLLKRNIRFHPLARAGRIDAGSKTIHLGDNSFPFDLLLYYAQTAPPPFIRESGLAGDAGWLKVNPRTMALPGEDSIFAVGDVTEIRTPSGELLPKMGVVAHLQSFVAAANMAALIKGEKPGGAYSGFAG